MSLIVHFVYMSTFVSSYNIFDAASKGLQNSTVFALQKQDHTK